MLLKWCDRQFTNDLHNEAKHTDKNVETDTCGSFCVITMKLL